MEIKIVTCVHIIRLYDNKIFAILYIYIYISFILYIKTHYKLEVKNYKNENA